MSKASETGVLYNTDYAELTASTPIASLWSYDTHVREHDLHSHDPAIDPARIRLRGRPVTG
jgi:hypothetical protein